METAVYILHQMNDYNSKVNTDMLAHLEKQDISNPRILELMTHTIHAHAIWLDRMQGRQPLKGF